MAMMTKDKLAARRAEMEKTKEQLVGQLNAVAGILQELDYWLAELEKDEKPKAEAKVKAVS
jgi:hypothetical protein